MLYVYVDFTSTHEPFYVGKGNSQRVKGLRGRNAKWHAIVQKHGHLREIVFASEIEAEVFKEEERYIAQYHTFVDDPLASHLASNFTTGGEGGVRSKVTRQRMSETHLNPPDELRHRISERMKGNQNAVGNKGSKGRERTAEHNAKIAEGIRKYHEQKRRNTLP